MNDEIDNSEFDRMICAMLDNPNDREEKEVYFYHSNLCGSRAQSQVHLGYAEMKQSVRSNLCGSRAQSQACLCYAEMKQSVRSNLCGSRAQSQTCLSYAEMKHQLDESDKAIQERQKDLSRRLDIVNKSAARVAKAISLGLIAPSDVQFLPRQ